MTKQEIIYKLGEMFNSKMEAAKEYRKLGESQSVRDSYIAVNTILEVVAELGIEYHDFLDYLRKTSN